MTSSSKETYQLKVRQGYEKLIDVSFKNISICMAGFVGAILVGILLVVFTFVVSVKSAQREQLSAGTGKKDCVG